MTVCDFCRGASRVTLFGTGDAGQRSVICPDCRGAGVTLEWHQGRKVGRTLYREDVLVGVVDTPELAAAIVAAMNAKVSP